MFKYLRIMLSEYGNIVEEVSITLKEGRKIWGRLKKMWR